MSPVPRDAELNSLENFKCGYYNMILTDYYLPVNGTFFPPVRSKVKTRAYHTSGVAYLTLPGGAGRCSQVRTGSAKAALHARMLHALVCREPFWKNRKLILQQHRFHRLERNRPGFGKTCTAGVGAAGLALLN
jgi:hypothetical protein